GAALEPAEEEVGEADQAHAEGELPGRVEAVADLEPEVAEQGREDDDEDRVEVLDAAGGHVETEEVQVDRVRGELGEDAAHLEEQHEEHDGGGEQSDVGAQSGRFGGGDVAGRAEDVDEVPDRG